MVRVAGLLDQVASGLSVRSPDGRTPQQTLTEIRERALELVNDAVTPLARRPRSRARSRGDPASARSSDATEDERVELEDRFARQIYPVLTPLAVGPGQPFPYISGLSLSLGVIVRDPESGEERFARVKVPEGPVALRPARRARAARSRSESAIAHFLPWLFPEMEIVERVDLPPDARRRHRDLGRRRRPARGGRVGAAEAPLRRRRAPRGVELDLAHDARPARGAARRRPRARLPDPRAARPRRRRAALRARPPRPEVRAVGAVHAATPRDADRRATCSQEIAQRDIVVQHPYDSFATSVEAFVRAAASDPQRASR